MKNEVPGWAGVGRADEQGLDSDGRGAVVSADGKSGAGLTKGRRRAQVPRAPCSPATLRFPSRAPPSSTTDMAQQPVSLVFNTKS